MSDWSEKAVNLYARRVDYMRAELAIAPGPKSRENERAKTGERAASTSAPNKGENRQPKRQ